MCIRIYCALAICLAFIVRTQAADNLIITEFMGANTGPLLDENGSAEDWIEIHNPGTNSVSLNGWYLTDTTNNYAKWMFPATNINPGGFLIVWASNKDRRVAGKELHTNFRLNDGGEYLGLIRPDFTIASQYYPTFPQQVAFVSYGIPVVQTTTILVATGALAQLYVPTNDILSSTWLTNGFDDSSWITAVTGIGFDTPDTNLVVIADSVADWSTTGTQGEKNWFYGYWNKTADANGIYAPNEFTPFPRSANPNGPDNYWTGSIWDWYLGNPPWDEISQTGWHPNGVNNAAEHWVMRRWRSTISGDLTVTWTGAKGNLAGNGVTFRVMHNGVQKDSASVAGNDGVGVNRTIVISNVVAGDFIDYSLDPVGPTAATDDGSDGSVGTMVVRAPGTFVPLVATDIRSLMQSNNATAYIRIPFTVTNAATIQFLTLRMRYDDGFVAYLNGVQVVNRNAIDFQNPLTWNSGATASRTDSATVVAEDINITPYVNLLTTGTNVLAIQGLNTNAADADFLVLPELIGTSVALGTNTGYFSPPTPGAANGNVATNIGPIISNIGHTPNVPQDSEDLIVTARVAQSFNAVSNVTLVYRVAYSNEVTTPMFDDGAHGDGAAGDKVYGATIPASAAFQGQMIRYYVSASDIKTNLSRMPIITSPSAAEPQYFGTIVDLAQTNGLPLFHWFIQNVAAAATEAGTRCSIFFNGQFRDNVGVTLHGQSSSGFPKKSYNFNLNKGYKMAIRPDEPDASDFAITSTWADRVHVRNRINTEAYQEAGSPANYSFALRVQQNETFFSVANFLEQGNEEYLERIGYDSDGALYKMYDTFVGVSAAEKKTRKYEGSGDLQTLYNAVSTVNPDVAGRTTYVWDNVNLPNVVDFLAVKAITADHDCCHKNYYFYHDNNVSGEWYALPWDFDLSLSHIWTSGPAYFDDTTYTNNPSLGVGNNNTLFAIFWNDPVLKSMWLRRTRTLADTLLQPPGTSTNADLFRTKFDAYAAEVRADAKLDKIKWGGAAWTPPVYGPANPTTSDPTNNFEIELARIKDFFLPGRRTFLYTPATGLPLAQSNFFLKFGAIDYNPASSNQAQEYVEILNTNNFAVDISGWKLKGQASFTFQPGTVIGITNRIFVTPNLAAFRARPTSPRAGLRMFATGPYKNQLSARGDTLVLLNEAGQTNASLTYTGTPSLAQQYLRITEMMYHPPPPGLASPYPQEDYECIELKNIGPVALNLNGVHFTNGVEFTFTSANVTNLAPGQTIVLAKNPAAFFFHYPGVTNVVTGPYIGLLENAGGEKVEIDDVLGEIILEFTYDNSWYPMTDGNGFSLVIVNENSPWQTWDTKAAWRPSGTVNGSPGAVDPAPVVVGAIVVNEVLAHTDFPDYDQIEIHNPTTNAVDVGDWWISDDFFTPRKYRIPAPRVIPPGGFAVFIESDFNAGLNAFLFSSHGDGAYVFSGLPSGELSGYYHGFDFDASENGVSFGRHFNSMTNEHFVAQGTNSFGATNIGPRVGPIIISEIMYHPPDVNGVDNSLDEYVELQNLTTNAVPLYDPAYPTNRWRLDDGINYTFGTNDVVAAKSFLVVANFNPTNLAQLQAFRTKYGVATNVPIVGPYSGQLDNSDEKIELRRPDVPDTNGTPFILVERVHYLDSAPWDVGADGIGPSLQRRVTPSAPDARDVAGYGNEPLNWFAALPNAGSPASTGTPPVIVQQPLDVLTIAGLTTNISLSVTGSAPLVYQWRKNGVNLPGETNATIQFNPVQASQAGLYSVTILNAAGYTISSNALLSVQIPVFFTQQPTNQFVQPGTNVTVAASAIGNGTLHWQWRFEGTNIPGASTTNFSFLNANLTNGHGNFSVVVTDDISTATSTNAFVFVMVRPGIILQPLPQQVLQGNTAMFVCQATGAPPIFYRWLTNGVGYTTNTSGIFIVPNVQTNYTVRANVVNGAGSVNSSSVALTMLRDFDGDGIADIWETNYFGFDTNNAADGLLDFDGDGMNNHDEFVAGTNPTNALSLLKLVQSATNASVLQFVAQTNKTYTLLCRTNLTDGLWSAVTNVLPSGTVRTITVNSAVSPPLDPERYYRVITPFIP